MTCTTWSWARCTTTCGRAGCRRRRRTAWRCWWRCGTRWRTSSRCRSGVCMTPGCCGRGTGRRCEGPSWRRHLFDLFGGRKAMIEWPFMNEYGDERDRQRFHLNIEDAILVRFGKLSDDARARLEGITDEANLQALHRFAITCLSREA